MKTKSKIMIKAGKKSWITRTANALKEKLSNAGKKAAIKRKENKLKAQNELLSIIPTRKEKENTDYDIKKERKNKLRITKKKAQSYKDHGITAGNLLLLLSASCNDIFEILKVMPKNLLHYITAEIDSKAIVEIQRKNREFNLNIELYAKSIGVLIEQAKRNFFASADIDLCSNFSTSIKIVFNALTRDVVKRGGLLSFTFDTRDAGIRLLAINLLGLKRVNELTEKRMCLIIPTLLAYIEKIAPNKWEIIHQPELYSDSSSGKGARMLFIMLKRIK